MNFLISEKQFSWRNKEVQEENFARPLLPWREVSRYVMFYQHASVVRSFYYYPNNSLPNILVGSLQGGLDSSKYRQDKASNKGGTLSGGCGDVIREKDGNCLCVISYSF